MSPYYDLILVGAGLANGLIAWRLKQRRPELRLLLLEQAPSLASSHTWSFHDTDLAPQQRLWLEPLICHRWPGYEVQFPERRRRLQGGYSSITGERFGHVIGHDLHDRLRLACPVDKITPDTVQLPSGETLRAGAVIDGRGLEYSPHLRLGYQCFLGQVVRLAHPHDLTLPVIMDASVTQGGGYRFVYLLPFDSHTLLIEDTHYVDQEALPASRLREHIAEYAAGRGWEIQEQLREEQGALPIILAGRFDDFWAQGNGQPRVGLRAGLFHPTTGYSLPCAVRLADRLAETPELNAEALNTLLRRHAREQWHQQRFFRLLNRMLFLAGEPENRWRVMQRFYGLPEPLIQRFYAGHPTLADKARVLMGKPPVPVGEAVQAMLKYSPHHFESVND